MDWIVKPWTVLAARPSRCQVRRLGPEGLRSLPREPVTAGTADPRRRPSVAVPFNIGASRAYCGRQWLTSLWPYWTERLFRPGHHWIAPSPTRRCRPSVSGAIRPLPHPPSVMAAAARPPLLTPARSVTGLMAPRGSRLPGGGRQPWSSLWLTGRTTPRRTGCDDAASGALATTRQRAGSSTSFRPCQVSQSPPAAGRAHRREMVLTPVNQGVCT